MSPRVAIVHHGFVPTYRVAFFERLARAGDVEYVVFHGPAPGGTGHQAATGPFAFPDRWVANREIGVRGRTVIAQPIVGPIARGRFAGVVVGAEFKFPASWAAAAVTRARGGALVLWGHGYDKVEDEGASRIAAGTALKAAYARRADAYLVYTEGGADRLVQAGLDPERVTVVRNTLDVEAQRALHAGLAETDEAELRAQLGLAPDSAVLVYLGRLYREKRLDELVEAARLLAARPGVPPVEVVVLGDGPELEPTRALAREVPSVRLLGGVYDDMEIARWLRVAAALVMPGKVGLAVNHALAHGVPVLTRASDLHAPEVEYLEHEVNSLLVPGDLGAYVDALAELVSAPAVRERLAAGALSSSERLGLDHMVHAFDSGVRRALAARGRMTSPP